MTSPSSDSGILYHPGEIIGMTGRLSHRSRCRNPAFLRLSLLQKGRLISAEQEGYVNSINGAPYNWRLNAFNVHRMTDGMPRNHAIA